MSFAPAPGFIVDGRYRLEQPLGPWSMGDAWRASDLRVSQRAVEIRFGRPADALDAFSMQTLEREADELMRGPRGLLDRGQIDGAHFLVTALAGPAGLPATREMQRAVAPNPFNPGPGMGGSPFGPGPNAGGSPFAPGPNAGGTPFAPPPPYGSSPFGMPPAYVAPPGQAGRFVGATVIGILLALICAALAVKVVLKRSHHAPPNIMAMATTPPQIDSTRIPVGSSPVLGDPGALVTIVEFSDFQCPFCGRVEATLTQLRLRYGGDLRIVWKNNPLPFHQNAQASAEAALAAGAQGRFWEMHDLLYANQSALTRPDLERYATQLGLDVTRFRNDLDGHTFASQIAADQTLARSLNASGTPMFFVNGTELSGAQPIARFTAAIDSALARARTIYPPNTAYATMTDSTPIAPPTPAPPPAPRPNAPDPTVTYYVPVGASPAIGPADALVTIVMFSDFQCPFCSRVEPTLDEVRRRYPRDVRIVWRNHPLPFHINAMPAAEAAMEVFQQQGSAGFWSFHDTLFANQRAITRTDLESYAAAQGVNMTRFRDALDRHTHQSAINADAALATSLGAGGTPSFYVNGRPLIGAQPIERFVSVIDTTRADALALVATGVPRIAVYSRTIAGGATAPTPSAPAPSAGTPGPSTVYTIRPNPADPAMGPLGAPVLVEHFSDFQCPFCSRVDPTIHAIETAYGSRVRVVWRNYPLAFHNHAMPAAEAAMEVFAQQGNAGFWRYHDTLFANQQALERADLERYASAQGIDLRRFRDALDRHTHEAAIRADMSAGDASGASMGTPATFVNGHLVSGAQPIGEFRRVIDAELAARP